MFKLENPINALIKLHIFPHVNEFSTLVNDFASCMAPAHKMMGQSGGGRALRPISWVTFSASTPASLPPRPQMLP